MTTSPDPMSTEIRRDGAPIKLGDVLGEECFQNGIYKHSDSYGAGVPILRITDFDNLGRLVAKNFNRVSLSCTEYQQFAIRERDVLVNRVNSLTHVGKSMLVPPMDEHPVFESNMMRIRIEPNSSLTPEYVAAVLQAESTRRFFRKVAKPAVAQASINQDDVRSVAIFLHPKPVQKRIAEILAAWNVATEKTEQLIALRDKQRAWLLTQVISASGQATKLGHFLKQVSRPVPKPTEPYWALGIRSHGKGTFQRFVDDASSVEMDELYALNRDDLIVNITFAWEGAIALVKEEDERCLVSHRFPTYEVDPEKANPDFVKYIVNCKAFFSQLALISPGGAGRNRVMNKRDFLKLEVSLPSLAEQKRLAQILRAMGLLIEKEQSLLVALKAQKRGLMQKLLTGQWRVKAAETEAR